LPHYFGHRQRLRERMIANGAETLPDYELLEVILFAARARGDVKPVAKALLGHFGGFAEMVSAEPEALAAAGLNLAGIAAVKVAREAALRLMRAELQQRPVLNSWDTPVYPREVVKRALELGASALILVHNHPSGDPTPSKADIAVTKDIKKAAAPLGVVLHDHVIIGRNRHTSLRELREI